MHSDDGLQLIRETVRLLEGVRFSEWPPFEVEVRPAKKFDAPMRVAILLRRRGEDELEQRFLAAFLKRVPDGVGYRFQRLVERLEKLTRA